MYKCWWFYAAFVYVPIQVPNISFILLGESNSAFELPQKREVIQIQHLSYKVRKRHGSLQVLLLLAKRYQITVMSDVYFPSQNRKQYIQCYRFNKWLYQYFNWSKANTCVYITHLKLRTAALCNVGAVRSHVEGGVWDVHSRCFCLVRGGNDELWPLVECSIRFQLSKERFFNPLNTKYI